MNIAFLHGGGQGSWVWQSTISALLAQDDAGSIRTLLLDAPGCGRKRGRQVDDLTLEGVADELIEDIRASGLTDVVLVGHSQAGQAMALMMLRQPELFKRFIYVSCSIPLPGQSVLEMIGNSIQGQNPDEVGWPFDPATTPKEQCSEAMFCNDMSHAEKITFLSKLGNDQWPMRTYAFRGWDHEHLNRVPSTFIVCLKDKILPVPWQHIFAARFRSERTVPIDAGHQAMLTQPHALAEIVRIESQNDAI